MLWCKNSWSLRNTVSWHRRTQPPLAIREVEPLCGEQTEHPIWGVLLGGGPSAPFLPLLCLPPQLYPLPGPVRLQCEHSWTPPRTSPRLLDAPYTWPFSPVKRTAFITGPRGELCRWDCRRPEGGGPARFVQAGCPVPRTSLLITGPDKQCPCADQGDWKPIRNT